MRIAILIYSLAGGGAERATAYMANAWAAADQEVVILTYGPPHPVEYPLAETVTLRRLDCVDGSGLLASLTRIARIRAALSDARPDVVLAMMSTANILLALASIGRPWRTVGSERVSPIFEPKSRVWRWLRTWAYGLLDVAVGQTDRAAEWLRRHTWAPQVRAVPNMVRWPLPDSQNPVAQPVVAPGRRLLLAVGRLHRQKGFDDLIEAFALVAADHADWDLFILGEGPQRAELEAQAARLGLGDRVRLPGRMAAMRNWYERADIFVLSSRYEGFPNVLLEAMAAGAAVISRDCDDGPREIIRPEVDGLLAALDEPGALSDALRRLMQDEELRRRLGARAVDVRVRFSETVVMALWDELLGLNARP